MKINIFLKLSLLFTAIALISVSFNFLLIHGEEKILAQGVWQMPEEKCVIDAVIRNGFEKGKIPIGEAVDYAELYAREIIRNLNILIVNTEKAANTAYNEKSKDDLYDLPPEIKCSKCEAVSITKEVCTLNKDTGEKECECVDCGCRCLECGCCPDCGEKCPSSKCLFKSCTIKNTNKSKITSSKCGSSCLCNGATCASGNCTCTVDCSSSAGATDDWGSGGNQDFYDCKYTCTCSGVKPFCSPLSRFASGVKIIQDVYYNKIVISNDNIAHLVDVEGNIVLCNSPLIDLGFIGGEIEIPEQLNRWKIVNALTDSRNKLEICITGYQHVLDQGMTKTTLLNCITALDEIETKEGMTILPGFEYFAATSTLEYLCFQDLAPIGSDYCYAYNSECFLTEEQRNICRRNKDSVQCEKIIEDLMYNFFCCEGVIK